MATTTIHSIINDLVKQRALFSAFDVTRILRNSKLHVEHHVVRGTVHKAMRDEAAYKKTTLRPVGIRSRTIIYHPIGCPAMYYDPSALIPKSTAAKSVVAPACLKEVTLTPDQDGRLNVPPLFIREMAVGVKGKVDIKSAHGEVIVTPYTGTNPTLSVHKSGKFRINPTALKKAGISGSATYKVQSFPNKILIR